MIKNQRRNAQKDKLTEEGKRLVWSKNARRFHVLFLAYFPWSKNPRCLLVLFSTKFWRAKTRRHFWLSCKLMKTFVKFSFVSNFSKLTFARFCKTSVVQPISIKNWILQSPTLQKELPQVSFLGVYRTTTLPHNFWKTALLWSYSCKKL